MTSTNEQEPPAETGLDRLRTAMRPGVSRGQVVVGLVLAILGFLAVVQVQSLNDDTEFAGARREDLISLLGTLEDTQRRTEEEIDELEARRTELQGTTNRRTAAVLEAQNQIEVLGVLAGTVPVTGPGIVVTVADPFGEVKTGTVLNALNEMRNAGAEAIEINNTVRVVAETPVVDSDEGITVGGVRLEPPYVFEVIGPPDTLETAMTFPGGLVDEVEELRGAVDIRQSDDIQITSLHEPQPPQYARPAD
jgi:uncharacterized protein YlxW (UPF0749 family)